MVSDATPDGPAQAAGIKGGDLIVRFANQPVENANQLILRAAEMTPGPPVPVDRRGELKTFNVTITRTRPGPVALRQA
ncbi:MAG: PDZ domain-containing protein [Verrucomicrobia bacterium]|nr:PDZ domain-containing protein [Verrucomicrobiota bacterium]